MRKSTRRLALAASAVLTLAAAGGVALAQVPPPPPAPPAPPAPPPPPLPPLDALMAGGDHMMFIGGPGHGRHRDPEARAQHLRDVLQLRADQEGVLKAYLDATAPKIITIKKDGPDKDGEKADKLIERKPPTTLERLDRMSQAADAMQKRASATKSFYLALSPSQQKAFDALDLEIGGPGNVQIRRFETRHELGKPGERKVIIQRKVG